MATPPPPDILSQFWAPLCAVGSHDAAGQANAQICVSIFGASIVPERPRVLVGLSNTNHTTAMVRRAGTLAISVLGAGQAHLLEPLGLHSGRDGFKLAELDFACTAAGDPHFAGAAGMLDCRVIEAFALGDSTLFLCSMVARETGAASPLSWAAARPLVGEAFLQRWAEKSAREQAAAREVMRWH